MIANNYRSLLKRRPNFKESEYRKALQFITHYMSVYKMYICISIVYSFMFLVPVWYKKQILFT